MIISIDARPILTGTKTYLSTNVSIAGTSLTVANTASFVVGDLVIIGSLGQEASEIVSISAVPGNTTLTVSALKRAHTGTTVIEKVYFDQVKVEKTTDGTNWTVYGTVTLYGDQVDIPYTISDALTTDTYRTRFYNSTSTTYSDYSSQFTTAGSVIDSLVTDIQRQLKARGDDLIQVEDIFTSISNIDMVVSTEIIRTNPDYFKTNTTINLTNAQADYPLPSTFVQATRVMIKYNVNDAFTESVQQRQEYGWGNEVYTGLKRHHIYQSSTDKLSYIGLFNVPTESYTGGLKVYYVKRPTRVTQMTDTLNTPHIEMFYQVIKDGAMGELYRFYKNDEASADRMEQKFTMGLRSMIEIINDTDTSQKSNDLSASLVDIYSNFN